MRVRGQGMIMKRMKRILKKLFCLPPAPTLLISIPAYGLVIYALSGEDVEPAVAYASYLLSAYALIITITGITGIVRLLRQAMDRHPLVRKVMNVPLVGRFLKEDMFRAETALYQGFFINLLYAGIKMCSGILYRSVWFITLVSMLSLETAMLTQFGAADDTMFRKIMTASTGAGVSILVAGMAVFMIVKSKRQLRQEKEM